MPGFLGGSTSGGGTGGEITFPKEFIDPVTKFRVSQPETLIDTDFEYGLQPTKWETVELINNTPSFFSKSGDTTIPNIVSVTTNAGTREITVTTGLDHSLAVGIPINVQGTKSITADGAYIINSIPNSRTFTYLSKDIQPDTLSIEDLYTSIITGEFFQGSQLRISDSDGIVTDGAAISTLTVKTESNHGFGVNTPFYFLNLNSTVAQEFEAANTAAKSFDSTNSATAQTFDGSNTLSQIQIDWSNSATVGGTPSSIVSTDAGANTITVTHTTETFVDQPLGTPLYYDVTTAAGYFASNPRGVVFLKTTDQLASGTSIFQVSEIPDGDAINIESSLTGTFQLANQARTFAGNNVNLDTQQIINVIRDAEVNFEGANDGGPVDGSLFINGNPLSTVDSYSGSIVNVSTTTDAGLGYYQGAMVLYETDGAAASGLTDNTTYFIDSFFSTGVDTYALTIKELPTDENPLSISGGTGTQTFKRIGVSPDKNIWHFRNANYTKGDMLLYTYPESGSVEKDSVKDYFFVETVYDASNYTLSDSVFTATQATGGTVSQIELDGRTWNVHTFTNTGNSTFTVETSGSDSGYVEYLVVAGGGGGGGRHGGGGGAGGFLKGSTTLAAGSYTVTVGGGGLGAQTDTRGASGGNSVFNTITAIGGGGGGSYGGASYPNGAVGGSGGGGGHQPSVGAAGTAGQGNAGGNGLSNEGGGGGGAGGNGANATSIGGNGGIGLPTNIIGQEYYFAGGGGGATWSNNGGAGNGGIGGGGGGGTGAAYFSGYGGPGGLNSGAPGIYGTGGAVSGGNGGANTGGGGGGSGQRDNGSYRGVGGNGGSGIVVVRYPVTPERVGAQPMVASGGTVSEQTVGTGIDQTTYRIHSFTTTGNSTFNVTNVGELNAGQVEVLLVAGGGGGGAWVGGGGGAGGVVKTITTISDPGNYTVTVGGGGTGELNPGSYSGMPRATNGGNSVFNGLTANGGGYGGSWTPYPAQVGGSGGGNGSNRTAAGNQPSSASGGYGNPGGAGRQSSTNGYPTGGGGGAGQAGQPWTPVRSGKGGIGMISAIRGSNAYYGGGGGGGVHGSSSNAAGGFSTYGIGGGGGGLVANTGKAPSGQANTGGGGGGNGRNGGERSEGGNGGTGIVVIRYPIAIRSGV